MLSMPKFAVCARVWCRAHEPSDSHHVSIPIFGSGAFTRQRIRVRSPTAEMVALIVPKFFVY